MDYSDEYLRAVLPEQDPPGDFVSQEVEEEIASWIERDRIEDRTLIARSARWTYAIINELRLNQVKINWQYHPFWPLAFGWRVLNEPLGVGLLDSKSEDRGFGLILYMLPNTESLSGLVARIEFPRLNADFPLWLREASYEDHRPPHPQVGTSAAWARCAATGLWGVLTAGHVVPGTRPGRVVPLDNGANGLLLRSCHPQVDCAFVLTDAPSPIPALLPTRRFPAAGQPVTVECKNGSVSRTVTEVETNMQVIAVRAYTIKVFLDKALAKGDSGALVKTATNEAVGIYLGHLKTPAVPTGFAGRALNFEQALFALDVTAFR